MKESETERVKERKRGCERKERCKRETAIRKRAMNGRQERKIRKEEDEGGKLGVLCRVVHRRKRKGIGSVIHSFT